ncbi:MAG: hypothetical protein ABI687_08830 [Flavitalea sp.]
MLSIGEKRFIRYWQDQRKGGRWIYYLLYIPVGTFICSLIISIFLYLFFQVVLGSVFLWFVFSGGFLFSAILTIYSWYNGEKKFRKIIRREVAAGVKADDLSGEL